MIEAKWRIDGLFRADPQKVYEEIGDNATTPEQVLEKAKDENSELHKCFDWDNEIAGEKWRLHQARNVINGLVFVPKENKEQPVRVFSYTPGTNYKPTIQMVVDMNEYTMLLKQARRELEAFKTKYKTLKELKVVFDAIDEL